MHLEPPPQGLKPPRRTPFVEISGDQSIGRRSGDLLDGMQLCLPVAAQKPQVGRHDAQSRTEVDVNPHRPARLDPRQGKTLHAPDLQAPGHQERIAVPSQRHIVARHGYDAKIRLRFDQPVRQGGGTRAQAQIGFLQYHHIGAKMVQDVQDALRATSAIQPAGLADIVTRKSEALIVHFSDIVARRGNETVGKEHGMQVITQSSPVLRAIWALLLLTALVSFGLARWSLAFVSLVTLILSLIPPFLAKRLSLTLPLPFLLLTTLFFIASIFLGEALDFYERLWWWDLALHGSSALGFGLSGFLFVFMLFEGDRLAAPPWALAFMTFCVAMTIGALWEIFEFGMDQTFGMTMQKSGLFDTMGDLILNAVGGGVASVTGYFHVRQQATGLLGRWLSQFIQLNRRLYRKSREKLGK